MAAAMVAAAAGTGMARDGGGGLRQRRQGGGRLHQMEQAIVVVDVVVVTIGGIAAGIIVGMAGCGTGWVAKRIRHDDARCGGNRRGMQWNGRGGIFNQILVRNFGHTPSLIPSLGRMEAIIP